MFTPTVDPKNNDLTREQNIGRFYDGLRDFIAMTNTNMYDGVYFALQWLNTHGISGYTHEFKADAKTVEEEGRKKIMNELQKMGFIVRGLNGYFEANYFCEKGMLEVGVYLIYHLSEFVIVTRNVDNPPQEIMDLLEPYRNKNIRVYEYSSASDNPSPDFKELSYKDKKDYHSEFYPWQKEEFEDFIKGFLESSSNALILIGPPGTGKTSWLKQFILRQEHPVMYSANTEVIKSGILFSEFSTSDAKILVMEDADTLTMKREDGNTTMSQLLNTLSGITSEKDKKIIISTNLPNLNKVDPALIRPGRCYRTLYFSLLTVDEANKARTAIGLEPIEFKKEKITLAEALNYTDEEDIRSRSQSSIGFN